MSDIIKSEEVALRVQERAQEISVVAREVGECMLGDANDFVRAVMIANGVKRLRELITIKFVEDSILPLVGSSLGMMSDKDYPPAVVRDVLIEGAIRGLRPVGNEINIIGGRLYAAKNGVVRLVREWPGISDLRVELQVPVMSGEKGALVAATASWSLNGVAQSIEKTLRKTADGEIVDTRISVRVNSGMGPDAVLGKATRKLYAAIYERLTDNRMTLPDGDALETTGEDITQANARSLTGRVHVPPVSTPTLREPGQEG